MGRKSFLRLLKNPVNGKDTPRLIIVHTHTTELKQGRRNNLPNLSETRWLDRKAFRGVIIERCVLIPTGILMYEGIS